MKPKKLNFSEMKNALSRSEMKQIMAGSGGDSCNVFCHQDAAKYCTNTCTKCEYNSGPGDYVCVRP